MAEVLPASHRKRSYPTAERRKQHHVRLWLLGSGACPAQDSSSLVVAVSKPSRQHWHYKANHLPGPRQFSPTGNPSNSNVGSICTTQFILAEKPKSASSQQLLLHIITFAILTRHKDAYDTAPRKSPANRNTPLLNSCTSSPRAEAGFCRGGTWDRRARRLRPSLRPGLA